MPLQQLLHYLSRSRRKAAGKAAPAPQPREDRSAPPSQQQPVLDRLTLQTAVIHHLEWCVLFNDHLCVDEQHAHALPLLPSAHASELGRWLQNMRRNLAQGDVRLDALVEENNHFHQLARQALALARQGRMDLASTLLNTDFERSRTRILQLLRQLGDPGA